MQRRPATTHSVSQCEAKRQSLDSYFNLMQEVVGLLNANMFVYPSFFFSLDTLTSLPFS